MGSVKPVKILLEEPLTYIYICHMSQLHSQKFQSTKISHELFNLKHDKIFLGLGDVLDLHVLMNKRYEVYINVVSLQF